MVSGRTDLHRRNPLARGGFDGCGRDASHAAVIRGAAPQKAGAAIRFFLHDAASRRYWSGAKRIGWSKDGDDREADSRGDVHRAGIIPDE